VVDDDGKLIGSQHETSQILPLFTRQYGSMAAAAKAQHIEAEAEKDRDIAEGEEEDEFKPLPESRGPRKRRMSIMGTFGYVPLLHALVKPSLCSVYLNRTRDVCPRPPFPLKTGIWPRRW
jgi:hypothetical protein